MMMLITKTTFIPNQLHLLYRPSLQKLLYSHSVAHHYHYVLDCDNPKRNFVTNRNDKLHHQQKVMDGRKTTIGFIGLGNMGKPMMENIISSHQKTDTKDEIQLLYYDSNPKVLESIQINVSNLLSHNHSKNYNSPIECIPLNSVSELSQYPIPNYIVTVLPNCESSKSVISEILNVVPSSTTTSPSTTSTVLIDSSTVSLKTSLYNHSLVRQHSQNIVMIDAPISGGVRGAKEQSLTFMLGMEKHLEQNDDFIKDLNSILSRMGSKIFVCGGPGSGIIVKLCNNLALASQMIGIAEAMNLGKSLGMDPVKLAQVMNVSTSGCWSSKVNNPMPEVASALQSGAAVQNYDGGFAVKLMLKDLGLALDAGLDKQLALPLATSARELYRLISLHGLDDKDFGVVLEFLKGDKKE